MRIEQDEGDKGVERTKDQCDLVWLENRTDVGL